MTTHMRALTISPPDGPTFHLFGDAAIPDGSTYGYRLPDGVVAVSHRAFDAFLKAAAGLSAQLGIQPPVTLHTAWFGRLYELVGLACLEELHDEIVNTFDDLLCAGLFATVDHALATVDVDRLNIDAMVSLLMFTLAAADKLPSRADAYTRFEARIRAIGPGRADSLLSGLR